jgi:hypothetical protein
MKELRVMNQNESINQSISVLYVFVSLRNRIPSFELSPMIS